MSDDEEARLLTECDAHSNPMLGWIVRVALYTGMRRGKILTLTRDQVNLSRRIIRLTDTKNGSARTVPLSKNAIKVFEEALDNPVKPDDTDLLFFGEPGKNGMRRLYTINKVWEMALKRAKITGLRFNDLRHEAVSRLVEKGLSDQEVSAVSGHKSMQMLKRYPHLRAEDLVNKDDAGPETDGEVGDGAVAGDALVVADGQGGRVCDGDAVARPFEGLEQGCEGDGAAGREFDAAVVAGQLREFAAQVAAGVARVEALELAEAKLVEQDGQGHPFRQAQLAFPWSMRKPLW